MRHALLAMLFAGCGTLGSTVEMDAAKVLISDDQESQIGLQVKQETEKQPNFHYLEDAQTVDYVRGVANKVIPFAQRDRPGIKWTVNVIDDPKTVNAFATPGGYLYVYSGLLLAASNEAELAGVMGHEAGHVVAHHSARNLVDQYGLDAVVGLAVGNNPGLLTQLAAGISEKGLLLTHSRADEDEADEYGARYSAAAGYDPHGLTSFFQKLQAQQGDSPAVLTYLSDHPATPDRIAHVNKYVTDNHLSGTELGAAQFAPIKAHVKGLPTRKSDAGTAPGGTAPGGTAPGGSSPGGQTPAKPAGGAPPN